MTGMMASGAVPDILGSAAPPYMHSPSGKPGLPAPVLIKTEMSPSANAQSSPGVSSASPFHRHSPSAREFTLLLHNSKFTCWTPNLQNIDIDRATCGKLQDSQRFLIGGCNSRNAVRASSFLEQSAVGKDPSQPYDLLVIILLQQK